VLVFGAEPGKLEPIDVRTHKTLSPEAEELLGFPEGFLTFTPKVSWIMRGWYTEIPDDGRFSADGAIRSEAVLLVETGVGGLRFVWRTVRDYKKGTGEYSLTYWDQPDTKSSLRVEIDWGRIGDDMSSFVEEADSLREKRQLDRGEDTQLTFIYDGREWTTTVAEWQQRSLLPADQELLELAIDDDLLEALDLVGAFARLFPNLAFACDLVVAPLTGQEKADCEATGAFRAVGGPADCTFDAGFGYPCSLEQRQRYTPPRNTDLIPDK
jgi:hypothetical protein